MKKVAKLVYVSLVTRVIVDENATEQDIMELAVPKLSEKLMDSPFEQLEEIKDDKECPFDPEFDEVVLEYPKGVEDDKSDEVYDRLCELYEKSDVVSGEFYHQVKDFKVDEFTEGDMREGIQTFLDWDESDAKFELKKGKKYWKIIDK